MAEVRYVAGKDFSYNGKQHKKGDPVDTTGWKHPEALAACGILKERK